jgi:hypothetical protein
MAKYIIFLDGEMKGYLADENSTKRAVSDLADTLVDRLRGATEGDLPVRVYRSNIDCGIEIYSQTLGNYINGSVLLKHTIKWQSILEYKP